MNRFNAICASRIGVSPLAFIPCCFLVHIPPVIDLIYAKTGFTVRKMKANRAQGRGGFRLSV